MTRCNSAFRAKVFAALLTAAMGALAADNVTFVSPVTGDSVHVGQILRIRFTFNPDSVVFSELIFSLSVNNGRTFAVLPVSVSMNPIGTNGYYDWPVPASQKDQFGSTQNNILSTVSDSCVMVLKPYPSHSGTGSGRTARFRILPQKPDNVVFTSPKAGDSVHVGQTLRIQFTFNPDSVTFTQEAFGLSVNSGSTFAFLPVPVSMDTIGTKGHYDWLVPASLNDAFAVSYYNIPNTACDTCMTCVITLKPYAGSTGAGTSGKFRILPSTAAVNRVSQWHPSAIPGAALIRAADGRPGLLMSVDRPATALLFSPDGRLQERFPVIAGTSPRPVTGAPGCVIVKLDGLTKEVPRF